MPTNCPCSSRLTSPNGMSIGTAMVTRPSLPRATRSTWPGNGQFGLVSFGTIRVSACTPTSRVSALPSTCGCAAMARTGLISSQRLGSPDAPDDVLDCAPLWLAPPSEMARHNLVHCPRAAFSMNGSLRSRASSAPICSCTMPSSAGFTALATLSLTLPTGNATSATLTCAARLGMNRQFAAIAGCEVVTTVPCRSTC